MIYKKLPTALQSRVLDNIDQDDCVAFLSSSRSKLTTEKYIPKELEKSRLWPYISGQHQLYCAIHGLRQQFKLTFTFDLNDLNDPINPVWLLSLFKKFNQRLQERFSRKIFNFDSVLSTDDICVRLSITNIVVQELCIWSLWLPCYLA